MVQYPVGPPLLSFCLCPPRLESLFLPVLHKSYNQIPQPSRSDSGSPGWEACHGIQNLHNSGRTSLKLLFSSLWVTHPEVVGFDFIMIAPLPPSHCGFFFVLDMGCLFLVGSRVLLLKAVLQLVVILVFS